MAKAAKPNKKVTRGERGKYDEKLAVNGSFMDIMKAAVKNAKDKVGEKKKQ